MRLLVAEDDKHLLSVLSTVLFDEEFDLDQAENGIDAKLMAEHNEYDAIILDIMLPEIDGISILRKLRANSDATPVLILTAKDSVESRVAGLDAGADDYLVKPFAIDELLARIRALLRRSKGLGVSEIIYGDLLLSHHSYDGFCSGKALKLTPKEYELLAYFLQNKEQILRRDQIFNRVWGYYSEANETAVDLYVHYIRKKLAAFGCEEYIRTIRSVGYMLKAVDRHA
ncbi:response regulator transcription factor [Paenibacillus sp. sptzw28]|uniref:response regulator transcription factor n=1 Tax=Paenibacillus sp. sptzw28 TaxID=715179 RepID=UPI001C6E8EF8|nr:response regulator transcription factor [Paenibacillus sp. sptzw28]QYR22730.1 response regulator transcription factor [Paenibacillus sp. sptzw28]